MKNSISLENISVSDLITIGEVANFFNKITGKKYRTATPVQEINWRSNLGIIFTCEDGLQITLSF